MKTLKIISTLLLTVMTATMVTEKLFKTLQNQIVNLKNIKFSKENIAVEAFSGGKTIIPQMVELEHK